MDIRIFHEVLQMLWAYLKYRRRTSACLNPYHSPMMHGRSLVRNGRKTMVLVAGDCDTDKKVRIYIARNSILFELSNFANKSESTYVVVTILPTAILPNKAPR